MNTETATTVETVRANLARRVEVCRMYAQQSGTIALHNTALVSSRSILRGVQSKGESAVVVAMYPGGMPSLWSPRHAVMLAEVVNRDLAASGSEERVRAMHEREWWAEALADAEGALKMLDDAIAARG